MILASLKEAIQFSIGDFGQWAKNPLLKPEGVRSYLGHIGLEVTPPARAPPQLVEDPYEFDQSCEYEEAIINLD